MPRNWDHILLLLIGVCSQEQSKPLFLRGQL